MAELIAEDDFRQKHISGWSKMIRALRPAEFKAESEMPLPEYYEIAVKAAVQAGWFADLSDPADVDEMRPGDVNKLGRKIWKLYASFQTAGNDPN